MKATLPDPLAKSAVLLAETPTVLWLPTEPEGLSPAALRALPGMEQAVILRFEALREPPAELRSALDAAGEAGILAVLGPAGQAEAFREAFRPVWRKWLRRGRIRAREALSPAQRAERSARAVALLADSALFRAAQIVMLYDHVGGELSLDALLNDPAAAGKRFCYPLCVSKTEMIAMIPGAWQPGAYGIREPVRALSTEIAPEEIDLVVCPGTAFDEACNRMGMGGGYYDRYLPRCTRAHIVMVAFELQKLPAVPTDPWDRPVERVFTEARVYSRDESKANLKAE